MIDFSFIISNLGIGAFGMYLMYKIVKDELSNIKKDTGEIRNICVSRCKE